MYKTACILFILLTGLCAKGEEITQYLSWNSLPDLPPVSGQTESLGVAGPFVGVHNDALIIAGGANFDKPYWEKKKSWHDDIWALVKTNDSYEWINAGMLDHPIAYGASVSTAQGVICMGGNDAERTYDDVFMLSWNPETRQVTKKNFSSLPKRCAYGSAILLRNFVYLAGGTQELDLETAMTNFWRFDLSQKQGEWEILPSWPGPSRGFNITVTQHNGETDCIYIISGRRQRSASDWQLLKDVYEFNPLIYSRHNAVSPWRRRTNIPGCVMAGTGIGIGQSHIFVLGGADGSLYKQADSLREKHPGFPKIAWGYHTITDTWFNAGSIPLNHLTTNITEWDDKIILASGEIKPRVRTPKIWKIEPVKVSHKFGVINFFAIGLYLLSLVLIGFYFSYRNKTTDDFFRGGQRVPWWASGCSIFATMLSSLTFMSIPAKTYATDWVYFLINMSIVILAPFIIFFILPFFRKINATSAYEYLEKRFNLFARLIASASYILFQIGRMAIVMFLPALALSTVTPISVETSILLMGLLSIIYCTLGGVEAVIWTDTLQTIVLLGGALLSFLLIISNLDGGLAYFFSTGLTDQKFKLVNWDWSSMSYTTTAIWVIVVGGLAQQLVPYSSDQGVVQRYMSVKSERDARSAIWTNAVLSFLGSIIFFALGTGFYVFYKQFPHQLDPTLQNDSIFPQFISSELPVGIAGIVIAGVFAAAQSTVSTSMNSIATAFSTDFIRRFDLLKSEKSYLRFARMITILTGIIGTGVALLFAAADIKSMWDSFITVIGLLGGGMCGLFILGIFTKRANGWGAVMGALSSAVLIAIVQVYTQTSFILYAAIGVSGCVILGYFFSLIFPSQKKDITGLTL